MEQSDKKFEISASNEKSLTITEAKFIFEQAEKQLKITVEQSNVIVTRTTILLSITVTILTSLSIFLINQFQKSPKIWELLITSILLFTYLFCLLVKLTRNIKGKSYHSLGSEPVDLLHDYYFHEFPDSNESNNKRAIGIYISEIKAYQDRIRSGKLTNSKRWKSFHLSLDAILFLPLVALITYSLVKLAMQIITWFSSCQGQHHVFVCCHHLN